MGSVKEMECGLPERRRILAGWFTGLDERERARIGAFVSDSHAAGQSAVVVSLYRDAGPALLLEEEKARVLYLYGLEPDRFIPVDTSAAPDWKMWLDGLGEVTYLPEEPEGLYAACEAEGIDGYARLCAQPYPMLGEVVHGRQMGRTVGMPTANLSLAQRKWLPPAGVYATLSVLSGMPGVYMGLTNVGTRPTVDSSRSVTVETFLLDLDRDLYGQIQYLEFHLYIRGVRKFADLNAVKAQVERDRAQVRERMETLLDERRARLERLLAGLSGVSRSSATPL